MSTFRCYALNEQGRIVAGENVEVDSLIAAIAAGWHFVASCPECEEARGLEVWHGGTMLFSTCSSLPGLDAARQEAARRAA